MIEGLEIRATFTFGIDAPPPESTRPSFMNLRGKKFGRLTVEERGPNGKNGGARWWCLCKCGKRKLVARSGLREKSTKSCGCWKGDKWRERVAAEKAAGHPRYRVNR